MCKATRTAFRLLGASGLPFSYFDATLDDLVRSRASDSLPRGAPLLSRLRPDAGAGRARSLSLSLAPSLSLSRARSLSL